MAPVLKGVKMSNSLLSSTRDGISSVTHIAKSVLAATVVFAFVSLAVPAGAEKGQSSYKHGRDLEALQNYEAAYDAYEQAYDADPRNTRYRAASPEFDFWPPRQKCTVRRYCSKRESSKRL